MASSACSAEEAESLNEDEGMLPEREETKQEDEEA